MDEEKFLFFFPFFSLIDWLCWCALRCAPEWIYNLSTPPVSPDLSRLISCGKNLAASS